MIYDVTHKTMIHYDGIVRLAEFNIRLKPAPWPDQNLLSFDAAIEPKAAMAERPSAFLAPTVHARIEAPLSDLTVTKRFRIAVDRQTPQPQPDDPAIGAVRKAALAAPAIDVLAPASYLYPSPRVPLDPAITAWCAEDLDQGRGIVAAGLALAKRIHDSFRYQTGVTDADTPVEQAFAAKAGVCQDFAHIMLAGLRGAGLSAAYVSGYLRTVPPPGKARLMGADATHAWVLIWCGQARGWLGFDPTNGCMVGDGHILSGVGRDYADVSPIDGVLLGLTGQALKVAVDVIPVDGG